jgi:hypothetical protein
MLMAFLLGFSRSEMCLHLYELILKIKHFHSPPPNQNQNQYSLDFINLIASTNSHVKKHLLKK